MGSKSNRHKKSNVVINNPIVVEVPPKVEEVYIPSESLETYPHIKSPEYLYKIIASRGDYVKLQEEITKHLNDGWSLVGGVSVAIHSDSYSGSTVFAQAIQKTT
jgi:hypothetical protein